MTRHVDRGLVLCLVASRGSGCIDISLRSWVLMVRKAVTSFRGVGRWRWELEYGEFMGFKTSTFRNLITLADKAGRLKYKETIY